MSRMDLIAIVGEYTNAAGETKKRFLKVGSLFDKGNELSVKIDAIPAGGWNGWLAVKAPLEETRDNNPRQQRRRDDFGTPF